MGGGGYPVVWWMSRSYVSRFFREVDPNGGTAAMPQVARNCGASGGKREEQLLP